MTAETETWESLIVELTTGLKPEQLETVRDAVASHVESGMAPDRGTLEAVVTIVRGMVSGRGDPEVVDVSQLDQEQEPLW